MKIFERRIEESISYEDEKSFTEDIRIKYHGGHLKKIPTTFEVGTKE